jgi:hypothetical protein
MIPLTIIPLTLPILQKSVLGAALPNSPIPLPNIPLPLSWFCWRGASSQNVADDFSMYVCQTHVAAGEPDG